MKLKVLSLVFLLCSSIIFAQAKYEEIYSSRLDQTRELKIQLPRNYDPEANIKYPLVVVLDGDYMFEPVSGNIDYQSYWDDMPDCIVVGVNQDETREDDLSFNEDTKLPSEDGAKFFEFLSLEVIPHIEKNYKVTPFRIVVGHDLSANFINFYLLKQKPLFRAFVAISPETDDITMTRIADRLNRIETDTFYYLATSDDDIKELRGAILEFDKKLKKVTNSKVHYKFDDFKDANHYSIVGRAVPNALSLIFELFKPITNKEYKEKVLTYSGTPYEYLEMKYDNIESFYGFKKKILENDLRAIASACIKNEDMESLEKLAKLAKKLHPDSMISAYYLGVYNEMVGDIKRALQYYQSGLLLNPSQFVEKDVLLDKIYDLKEELGQ